MVEWLPVWSISKTLQTRPPNDSLESERNSEMHGTILVRSLAIWTVTKIRVPSSIKSPQAPSMEVVEIYFNSLSPTLSKILWRMWYTLKRQRYRPHFGQRLRIFLIIYSDFLLYHSIKQIDEWYIRGTFRGMMPVHIKNILEASTGYSHGVNAFARSRTFISPNIILSNTGQNCIAKQRLHLFYMSINDQQKFFLSGTIGGIIQGYNFA